MKHSYDMIQKLLFYLIIILKLKIFKTKMCLSTKFIQPLWKGKKLERLSKFKIGRENLNNNIYFYTVCLACVRPNSY